MFHTQRKNVHRKMCLNVKYTTYLQRMLKEKTIKECWGTHLKKPKTVKTLMGNVFNTQNMLTMQKYTQDCSRNTSRTNIQYVLCIIFWYNYSTIYARIAFIKNLHWNLSCLCFINDEKCTAWHDTLYILNKTKNNQDIVRVIADKFP